MAFTDVFYGDWAAISLAAAVLSVILASVLIMLGRILELKNLEKTAKSEFVYAVSTVIIVILVVGLIGPFEQLLANGSSGLVRSFYLASFNCDPTVPLYFPSHNTLIDWMKLYLAAPASCVQGFMSFLYALSIPVEAMASQYMEIFMSEVASGFGFKWVSERITTATQGLSFYMYIYYLLYHILNFIKYYSGLFFSVGVALRAFPPTRGVGAYIMAMSIGFYFVFPLSYIMLSTMSMPLISSSATTPEAGTCQLNSEQNSIGEGGIKFACALPKIPADATVMQCAAPRVESIFRFKDYLKMNSDTLEEFLTLRLTSLIRHLMYSVCVFPFIAFLLLITFVLNTTSLFGGTIPEVGRGLVKLI